MRPMTRLLKISLILAASWTLSAGLVQAADHDRNDRNDRNDRHDQDYGKWQDDRDHGQDNRQDDRQDNRQYRNQRSNPRVRFAEQDRVFVHDYYEQEFRGGRCPSGNRANKRNNCWAPGHVKQWQLGQRMPRGMVYYDVPPAVVVQIGRPPAGARYVRVASDILLLSLATGLIIDAIEDSDRR